MGSIGVGRFARFQLSLLFFCRRVWGDGSGLALENGADDYITKPFSLEVLRAKVHSVLRRAYGEYAGQLQRSPAVWQVGGLILDADRNLIAWEGMQIELSVTEFRLVKCLAQRAGRIVTREELLTALWDDVDFVDDNTLTVNVARVRRRMEEIGLHNAIVTKRGQGYQLILEGTKHEEA